MKWEWDDMSSLGRKGMGNDIDNSVTVVGNISENGMRVYWHQIQVLTPIFEP